MMVLHIGDKCELILIFKEARVALGLALIGPDKSIVYNRIQDSKVGELCFQGLLGLEILFQGM
jgi:hypothetical protein